MNFKTQDIFKTLLIPIYVLFIAIPNIVEYFVYLYYKNKIKVTRKNCIFLINTSSGKKMGTRIMEIINSMKKPGPTIDVIEDDATSAIKTHLDKLPAGEKLTVVVCGGDGTISKTIDNIESEIGDRIDDLVFAPMPLGTGNDLSRSLNFGEKISIGYINEYFNRLNSPNSKLSKMDMWKVNYKPKDPKQEGKDVKMFLYFGIGYDARITKLFDNWRKQAQFLFQVNVV